MYVGVEEWVYFGTNPPTAALLDDLRAALIHLLRHRIRFDSGVGGGGARGAGDGDVDLAGQRFIDAICEARGWEGSDRDTELEALALD